LAILGILALAYCGIRYSPPGAVLEVDPLTTTRAVTNNMPLSPIVGGIGLISGIALMATPRRRTTPGWFEPCVPSAKPNDPSARGRASTGGDVPA